jgi:divalent metal cation (Fe/Co/Zn/Cd) transporter
MIATLMQYPHRYGFLGIEGFVGLIIGLIIFICIVGASYKLIVAVATKFQADANTIQIIYWAFVILVLLLFLHLFGLY